jgi:cellulose synthase/poly-beta-1,6-N-acetylglucosamine synthase-like glycosyltransferase
MVIKQYSKNQKNALRSGWLRYEVKNQSDELPSISIIVASLNNESTIKECLLSILDQDYPQNSLEVLVVDGGSTDSTAMLVKNYNVQFVSNRRNVPAAYNLASKIVKNEVLGFIDADAKVEKDWLKKLIADLSPPEVAATGGNIVTWNKNELVPRCIGYELSNRYSRLPREVKRLATMNLLVKKQVLEEIGGFDENLPTQYDTDLGYRITSAGYKIVFDPKALCYHFHRSTLLKFFTQQYKYGQNTWKLYLKHPSLTKGDPITDWGMNIQPGLLIAAIASLVISLIPFLTLIGVGVFLSLGAIMLGYYAFSAGRVARKYDDASALFLVIIYFTRTVAWTLGALGSMLHSFLIKVGLKKS